ncbi:hypothetical protein [Actinomadura sp. GC306]|uniref:hypothetical protein n=1 Tax=Actinomadura sp. GC306 TaxID=2530367 RepID=UPI001A9E0FB1|nr:hypothetical protein [Actinomadura sp. GC306]
MTDLPKWSGVGADVVAAAGGEEAVAEARKRSQAWQWSRSSAHVLSPRSFVRETGSARHLQADPRTR